MKTYRRETEMVPVRVEVMCNTCKVPMEFTGRQLLMSPPLYPHVCPKCGLTMNIRSRCYPRIEYRVNGEPCDVQLPVAGLEHNNE